jgi:hypothetical protein
MSRVSNNLSGIPSKVVYLSSNATDGRYGNEEFGKRSGRNIRIRIEFGMIDQHIGIERWVRNNISGCLHSILPCKGTGTGHVN